MQIKGLANFDVWGFHNIKMDIEDMGFQTMVDNKKRDSFIIKREGGFIRVCKCGLVMAYIHIPHCEILLKNCEKASEVIAIFEALREG